MLVGRLENGKGDFMKNNYFAILLETMKKSFVFGKDTVLWFFVRLSETAIGVIALLFLFTKTDEIGGLGRDACLLIYGLYHIGTGLFYALFAWTLWYSQSYVIEGRLITVLVKPVNPFLYLTAKKFSASELFAVLNGSVIFIYIVVTLEIGILHILLILLLMFSGVLACTGLFLLLDALACKYLKLEEAFSPFFSLLQFAQYPLNIYSSSLRLFLTFIIPIGLIAYYPALPILDQSMHISKWLLPFVYGFALFGVGYGAFCGTIHKFTGTGT